MISLTFGVVLDSQLYQVVLKADYYTIGPSFSVLPVTLMAPEYKKALHQWCFFIFSIVLIITFNSKFSNE